jgi:hypothetical protein
VDVVIMGTMIVVREHVDVVIMGTMIVVREHLDDNDAGRQKTFS